MYEESCTCSWDQALKTPSSYFLIPGIKDIDNYGSENYIALIAYCTICTLLSYVHCPCELQGSLGGVGYAPLNMLGVIQVIHVLCVIQHKFISSTTTKLIFAHTLSVSEDCGTASRSEGEQYYL